MCNCSSNPVNICSQCSQGNTCGCPPDYSIIAQPVPCSCCPAGYTFFGPTPNFPDGYCGNTSGSNVPPIPCNDCSKTMSADCIFLPAISCLGLPAGTTVSQLANFLCSPLFIQKILSTIGLNATLGSGFCQLVQNCPALASGTTPIIGSIIITYP